MRFKRSACKATLLDFSSAYQGLGKKAGGSDVDVQHRRPIDRTTSELIAF